MPSKKIFLWLGLVCIFAAVPFHSVIASLLPALGDTKSEVELQYGRAYVLQEDNAHFWTEAQLAEKNELPMQAKAYGYAFSARGLNKATLWLEYDKQDRVSKETVLFDVELKIRNLGQYFPDLHAEMTGKDNAAVIIRNYPQDQLAVRLKAGNHSQRWVRFLFTGDDKTCINMHSKIRGFEITEISSDTIKGLMRPGKAAGCQFNRGICEFSADGTWQRTDNYFLPQLYFSERLIPRKKTDLIVIHHAAMPTNTSQADIHDLHLTNGWAGIGYQKLVFDNGAVENGRPEQMVGAHAYGANQHSLGIVLVGDFRKVRPAHVQLEVAAQLTLELMRKYKIPLKNLRPHREVNQDTDCPGLQFPWQEFVQMIAAGLK